MGQVVFMGPPPRFSQAGSLEVHAEPHQLSEDATEGIEQNQQQQQGPPGTARLSKRQRAGFERNGRQDLLRAPSVSL